jgi:hypothetical protein
MLLAWTVHCGTLLAHGQLRVQARFIRPCGADKVKPLSLYHRFVIALHSPDGAVETGLLGCPLEKKAAKLACSIEQDTFPSGLRARVAELRPFPANSRAIQADFSALQTVWRRGRDSFPLFVLITRNLLIPEPA